MSFSSLARTFGATLGALGALGACSAVLGLDPVELGGAPVDAALDRTSILLPDAADATEACVEPTTPSATDSCALGLTDADAIRFGALSSEHIAVTDNFVYVAVEQRLLRYPRALFQSGRGMLSSCGAESVYTFSSSPSLALVELTSFDADGVCAILRDGQPVQQFAACMHGADKSLVKMPAFTPDDGDLIQAAPSHIVAIGGVAYVSLPAVTAAPASVPFDLLASWAGPGATPKSEYRLADGSCGGFARDFGRLTTVGGYGYGMATTDRGTPDAGSGHTADCRARQLRRFGGPTVSRDYRSMVGFTAVDTATIRSFVYATPLTGGANPVFVAPGPNGGIAFGGWDRVSDLNNNFYTSFVWDFNVNPIAIALGPPSSSPALAVTHQGEGGADAFELLRGTAIGGNTDNLQSWRDLQPRASRTFHGASSHDLVARDDSIYLAVRRSVDVCGVQYGYIARTGRGVP